MKGFIFFSYLNNPFALEQLLPPPPLISQTAGAPFCKWPKLNVDPWLTNIIIFGCFIKKETTRFLSFIYCLSVRLKNVG